MIGRLSEEFPFYCIEQYTFAACLEISNGETPNRYLYCKGVVHSPEFGHPARKVMSFLIVWRIPVVCHAPVMLDKQLIVIPRELVPMRFDSQPLVLG